MPEAKETKYYVENGKGEQDNIIGAERVDTRKKIEASRQGKK